ncbi:MAG: aspartyl protease family protein [Blastomonas sp.]
MNADFQLRTTAGLVASLALLLASGCANYGRVASTIGTEPARGIQLFEASIGSVDDLKMFIDTGVDPSVVDEAHARRLGLPIDDTRVGEAEGSGDGEGLAVRFSSISGLNIAGVNVETFDALAADLSGFGSALGVDLVAILGHSFLKDRVVRIDYRTNELSVSDTAGNLPPLSIGVRERTELPFKANSDEDPIPVFEMTLDGQAFQVSLDTGKSGGVEFFGSLEERLQLANALRGGEQVTARGARGEREVLSGQVDGLAINSLQLGSTPASIGQRASDGGLREANAGNATFAGMVITIDYPNSRLVLER